MPPRKTTVKASPSDPDPTELIISYLKSQNRPYSATDISSNLHNKVTKTKTDRFLKEMFERKEIDGKVSGKQWVYWYLQVCCSRSSLQEESFGSQ
jgi:26S proteasome regulatory subunit, ATPase 3, interacting protein